MSHPPMKWDELNGFLATDEEIVARREARERVLRESDGRIDIVATSAAMYSPWLVSVAEDRRDA